MIIRPTDIRVLRARLNMNQTEFAQFIGLASQAMVSRLEKGKEAISDRVAMTIRDKIRILELEEEISSLREESGQN